ncbi:MAG: response regulator transcription factor [Dokdonella sp.]|nr:response regulator transcription factor [Dechloromonas sp.]TXI76071.1 MAG: response regulator transcription factor [Dokdonella sp.]
MANRLLIVEDDRDLARNLIEYLELQGYVTDFAADGQTALQLVAAEQFDLVVLDLMLPVIDGLSVCTRIRQQLHSHVPVVMLTAKDEVDLKVAALDIGADDYVVKPASLREIEARIRALIRRTSREVESDVLIVDDLRFDTGTMKIERAGVPIVLPPVPMRILMLLMRRSPNVVHRQAIHREIWGDETGDAHALIVHMHMLRNAVDKSFFRQIIHTVRGFGYRIAYEPEAL